MRRIDKYHIVEERSQPSPQPRDRNGLRAVTRLGPFALAQRGNGARLLTEPHGNCFHRHVDTKSAKRLLKALRANIALLDDSDDDEEAAN
jgi:hypothetical protein